MFMFITYIVIIVMVMHHSATDNVNVNISVKFEIVNTVISISSRNVLEQVKVININILAY